MSAHELDEWVAYYELEPYGHQVELLSQATTTAIIAETHRDRKRRTKPYKAEDFMLKIARPKTWQEIKAKMCAVAAVMGSKHG